MVNSPITMASVRNAPAQDRNHHIRQDDPGQNGEPPGPKALRGLGQRGDINGAQSCVNGAVHIGQAQAWHSPWSEGYRCQSADPVRGRKDEVL